MRVALIGTPADRARVRGRLEDSSLEIVGEFSTVAEARAAQVEVEAFVLADTSHDRPTSQRGRPFEEREPAAEPLTPREVDVLHLLAEGLSNKAIGVRLGISDQTVKFHVSAIYGKLAAANRTDAVRRAVRRGLITL
ncbi:MAG: response regulator transcription factor [Vicinamibacterales bacterium]